MCRGDRASQRPGAPSPQPVATQSLPCRCAGEYKQGVTHAQLVRKAVAWLRLYRCGIVLSEQVCASGEMPDAIGWKGACHSVLVECKLTRADFFADHHKPFRQKSEMGMGCERFYLAPRGVLDTALLPAGWGLLECNAREVQVVRRSRKNLRSKIGFRYEMNLLLASLRRVEIRIEPETITDFLKWKNRMAEYNRGTMPQGMVETADEDNVFLEQGFKGSEFRGFDGETLETSKRCNLATLKP